MSALGISRRELQDAIEIIRTLDPKPGSAFADSEDDRVRHIVPDFRWKPMATVSHCRS